jgi:hypothetical protein
MLNYLYRLLNVLGENANEILSDIKIKERLSEQDIAYRVRRLHREFGYNVTVSDSCLPRHPLKK